ncbi:MAG: electron transport complex subunit RsxB [Gammaproteobacteria bacterium]|nr:electron transport complex subunit RsxB [Gammaproteobacteria bacterium]
MLMAVIVMGCLAALIAVALGLAATRLNAVGHGAIDQINALLPQTQCGQCGFPGCRPYAAALAAGTAQINQCPPGGEATIQALGRLLGQSPIALNPDFGVQKPKSVAVIAEDVCIGCARCLPACPVDAILGAPRYMHTVIAAECTGCELCITPCPVDCIELKLVN